MKKTFLLFLVIFQVIFLYSQTTFITDIHSSDTTKVARVGVENGSKDLFLAGFYGKYLNKDWAYIGEYLVKLDSAGNKIKEYFNLIPDTALTFQEIFLTDTNLLLVSTKQALENGYDVFDFYIKKFDFNLNLLSSKSYSFPDSLNATRIRAKITDEETIYIYGHAYSENNYHRDFIYKINNDTSVLRFYDSLYRPALHILKDNSICLTSIYKNTCNRYGSLVFLDSNLNFSNYLCFDEEDTLYIEEYDNLLPIDDNKYIFNGLGNWNTNNFRILDSNFNVIKQSLYDNYTYMEAANNNMDFIYQNHIYVSNLLNFQTYSLTKTDTALNKIYQKIITFSDNWLLNGVVATRDSGCLMIAIMRGEQMGVRAIKFDQYGNLPTNLPPEIKISDFAVYPNPTSDFINIKKAVQIEKADFVLYNSVGQKVLQSALNESITNLNISNLQKGVYIYNILENGQVVDTGKIIVE